MYKAKEEAVNIHPLDHNPSQIIKLRHRNWPIGKESRLPDLGAVILRPPKQLFEEEGSPLNLNHIQSVFAALT